MFTEQEALCGGGPPSQPPSMPRLQSLLRDQRGGGYGVVNTVVDTRSSRVILTSWRDSDPGRGRFSATSVLWLSVWEARPGSP